MFRNDPAEQFAIPMHLVAPPGADSRVQIDSVGGSKVLQYRGGSLPLLIAGRIHFRPAHARERLAQRRRLHDLGGREVGLLIREVVDIHTTDGPIDGTLFRQPGVIGSMVVEGKTTRLLDLFELTAAAHPEWVVRKEAAAASGPRTRNDPPGRGFGLFPPADDGNVREPPVIASWLAPTAPPPGRRFRTRSRRSTWS